MAGHLEESRTIAAVSAGSGAPVVLLHGVGLAAQCWQGQMAVLADSHAVHAPDLPGHGASAPLASTVPGLPDFCRWIEEFIADAIAAPVILVGHSMGALMALDIATRRPDLCCGVAALNAIFRRTPAARRAVVERATTVRRIADSGAGANREEMAAISFARGPLARWFGNPPDVREQTPAALCRDWLMTTDPAAYAAAYAVFAAEDGPADAALAALSMPALFLTGEKDGNSTPAMTRAMARLAPQGRSVIVRGGRHLCHLTHSEAVNAALADFCRLCTDHADLESASETAAAGGHP